MPQPKTNGITQKQREVLNYLHAGRHPAEIAQTMGISTNGVYQHMKRLKEAGLKWPDVKRKKAGRKAAVKTKAAKVAGKKAVGRPKGTGKPVGRPKSTPVTAGLFTASGGEQPVSVESDQGPTVEAALGAELTARSRRLEQIQESIASLTEEQGVLEARIPKLEEAWKALH
jgi:biotin operon repressor